MIHSRVGSIRLIGVGQPINQSPVGKALNVRIEAEDHPAPLPNRFKFTISSFRLERLLAEHGTRLKRILEDDMCPDKTFGFRHYSPFSGIRRPPASGKVDRVSIGAVGPELERLQAACPINPPSPDDRGLGRVHGCAREGTCQRREGG